MLALAALDPILVLGDRRVDLGVHEWRDGTIDPGGMRSSDLTDGIPRWRWQFGEVILERELAAVRGRPAVVAVHRLIAGPSPVKLELSALSTWRDAHGERFANRVPDVEALSDGYVFEHAYRVSGPGFIPTGGWYVGAHYREDRRSLPRGRRPRPDRPRGPVARRHPHRPARTGRHDHSQCLGRRAVCPARGRSSGSGASTSADPCRRSQRRRRRPADARRRSVVVAGPTVVAGYPWFGDWSRDTMTSHEGLLLETGRAEEGRRLLMRTAATLSEGMLANTADPGTLEYNTADRTLWFMHAIGRHVKHTGDLDLAAELATAMLPVTHAHVRGTRYGIHVRGCSCRAPTGSQ